MHQPQDSEGLQVDTHSQQAAKAPEVAYDQNGNPYYLPPGYQPPSGQKSQNIPFGLGVWTFAALVALLTAIVVGAGVGGGLGAALANAKSDDNCSAATAASAAPVETSTPTECTAAPETTTTSADNDTAPYVPRPADEVQLLELDCPKDKSEATSFKSSKGYDFKWWCGVNAPAGSQAEEGGVISDASPLIAYTLQDCLNACSAMIDKDENEGSGVKCRSVVFGKRMSEELGRWGVNCWLKNGTKTKGSEWGFKDDWYAYAERVD
ncbi:Hypothetical protein NCS54_01225700 [Fusarium falciforme]|uniref:Hypothetical protein n=1 Tax=Fusarium falciforme TaxID=195108 RepID=UPI00230163F6|nr:Hypothetical protein NCS54_01225700 [Fusarium falciforme]KAJ4246388.1 hypothetical protein NW757_009433 [Fusarium falciforme]WAO94664.1 Hypothetical protein NCS54_01225700 [Fusarium falciforme]